MTATFNASNDFNPRSHKGSDGGARAYHQAVSDFNPRSHKGSDKRHSKHSGRVHDFNPRSHKGSDLSYHSKRPLQVQFQSTLPQGERHHRLLKIRQCCHFNPRSHKGSDSLAYALFFLLSISIHAPTRGATHVYHVYHTYF